MTRRIRFLTCCAIVLVTAGVARAQSASTCAFDPATARVTVSVNGLEARVQAVAASGEIWLNGASCGGATVFNTDTIQVNGSGSNDEVELSGKFVPGLTPEPTGGSEIEISFALGTSMEHVIVKLGPRRDRLVFTSDGIDVGNDGDPDILTQGTSRVFVYGRGGNDHIDASAYTGSNYLPAVVLHGGPGNDVLIGSAVRPNDLYGEDGDDVLYGGGSEDQIHGGMGNDRMLGAGGRDYFWEEATADGADDMRGGDGIDQVRYRYRTNGVVVTIGDTEPDGEPGEGDLVHGDIENLFGGYGPDVLVGNGQANDLSGWYGDDELYGGGGNDLLTGFWGNDVLVGDGGDDKLEGREGDDFLDGGLGADALLGDVGNDVLQGGPGADMLDGGDGPDEFFGDDGRDTFINADAFAETVDCGAGTGDDPQPSALDTFIGCEEI